MSVQMQVEVDTDAIGPRCLVTVPASVYPLPAVLKAAYWHTDTHYVFISPLEGDRLVVELRPKERDSSETPWVAGAQFCNQLLDFAVRHAVHSETQAVRDAIVTAAFREAATGAAHG